MVMEGPRAHKRRLREEQANMAVQQQAGLQELHTGSFLRGGFRGAEGLHSSYGRPRLTEALSEQSLQRVAGEAAADSTGRPAKLCSKKLAMPRQAWPSVWAWTCGAQQCEAAVMPLPTVAVT